jgi:uncharacterized ferritin-like protein (DUF455 family)
MDLSAFAARVLHGTTLADKLDWDGIPADASATAIPRPPRQPGRPAALAFRAGPAGAPGARAPTRARLESPAARADLLHRLANHELLALELMALCLLRFPSAPTPFRRALARMMHDEQVHAALYLERLAALGHGPGDFACNTFLWDAVAPADTPFAFVRALGLVFEQANLDHALHLRALFAAVGDDATAAVLDRVHADEIRHVRHDLHWFRQWKPSGQSDWDAFTNGLDTPLSPARARGPTLDRASRSAAGFDPDFIDALARVRQSRGRPPAVWWMAPGPGEPPPTGPAAAVLADLALIPALLAAADDAVAVPAMPAAALVDAWLAAGLPVPEWQPQPPDFGPRSPGPAMPWGWSASAAGSATAWGLPVPPSTAAAAALASKAAAAALRPAVIAALDGVLPVAPGCAGALVHAPDALDAAVAGCPGDGFVLLKAPFASAGRGLRRVGRGALSPADHAWAARALAHGPLVVEPWLDRVADLSLHLDATPDGTLRTLGFSSFVADARGQWRASIVGLAPAGLPADVCRWWSPGGAAPRFGPVAAALRAALAPAVTAAGYAGPLGVDLLLARGPGGALALHPLVEINPRWTFGRVALALGPRVGAPARIRTVPVAALGPGGAAAFLAAAPARTAHGRLVEGRVPLADPATVRVVLPVLEAGAAAATPLDGR